MFALRDSEDSEDKMALIPGETIEEIRNRFDIVEVISSYIELKKTGRNFVGFCPFHSEKSPSFTVSPEKQVYYCFGCQNGGNLFTFIMQIEDCSFPEAVRLLAERVGINIDAVSAVPQKEVQEREVLLKIHFLARQYYENALWKTPGGKKVLDYLLQRGLTEQTIRDFHLGYADSSWRGLTGWLSKKGYSLRLAVKGGLAGEKNEGRFFDYFRERLIFPIWDSRGRVIAFGGRILGQGGPKYLNSPESPLFQKGRNLYGFHLALPHIRREKLALLVEGYMDVLLLHQHGIKEALAPLGTSLTEKQFSLLRGRLNKIILAFDADTGGEVAALRGAEMLKNEGCQVLVAQLPEGQDPADFIKEHGEKAFRSEILEKARPIIKYRLYTIKKKHDLQKEEERIEYWKESRKILAGISETLEREQYLKKIAKEINVSLEVLRGDLEKIIHSNSLKRGIVYKESKSDNNISLRELVERELITCIIHYPHCLRYFKEHEIDEAFFTEGPYRKIVQHLFDLDRQGKEIEMAALLSYFSDQEMHKLIIKMFHPLQLDEKEKVDKIVLDCIRKIKILSWAEEREKLIKSLRDTVKRDEIEAKLQRIQDLKKREEELYRSGEGEDFDG
ncbi:MAG TPA: DNA primase [Firmicutes bacterium]|nr:DNA primase [Bacillota bacterium]